MPATATRKLPPAPASDALDLYFDEISRNQLLSESEERELARQAREGDESALQALVSRNLRFVVSVAKRYQHHGLALDDLIAEGNVGLLAAARRFNPDEGVRFITYAVWWVRQAILIALTKQTRVVRIPASRLAKRSRLAKASNLLRAELGREPSQNEVADRMGVATGDIEEWQSCPGIQVSLDAPVSELDARSLSDQLIIERDDEIGDDEEARASDAVRKALKSLMPREAQILRRYFGLDGASEATLDVLASEMGITRERVRQLRDRALGKLRHGSHATTLRALGH